MTPSMTLRTSVGSAGGCSEVCSAVKSTEPGGRALQLLDARREAARMAHLLDAVRRQRLGDLVGADAIEVRRVGEVAHHGLHLPPAPGRAAKPSPRASARAPRRGSPR